LCEVFRKSLIESSTDTLVGELEGRLLALPLAATAVQYLEPLDSDGLVSQNDEVSAWRIWGDSGISRRFIILNSVVDMDPPPLGSETCFRIRIGNYVRCELDQAVIISFLSGSELIEENR